MINCVVLVINHTQAMTNCATLVEHCFWNMERCDKPVESSMSDTGVGCFYNKMPESSLRR
jgi:hypothetical protein